MSLIIRLDLLFVGCCRQRANRIGEAVSGVNYMEWRLEITWRKHVGEDWMDRGDAMRLCGEARGEIIGNWWPQFRVSSRYRQYCCESDGAMCSLYTFISLRHHSHLCELCNRKLLQTQCSFVRVIILRLQQNWKCLRGACRTNFICVHSAATTGVSIIMAICLHWWHIRNWSNHR